MSIAELETAVLDLSQDEQLSLVDKIWDRITLEREDDVEMIHQLRTRIHSEEFDGPAEIEAARNRTRA
ncbi:MAG: hypothetical protein AAF585_26530 [Verrucomicrobiota bacterium]